MDPLEWLREHLEEDDSDLLREMVRTFAECLMGAEVEAICNAADGEITPECLNSRNGYRQRDSDTRLGSTELAIEKLRHDSYHPSWLLGPRRRAERALTQVMAECYVRRNSAARFAEANGASMGSRIAHGPKLWPLSCRSVYLFLRAEWLKAIDLA